MKRRPSDDTIRLAAKDYEAGLTLHQIAAKYGRSFQGWAEWLAKSGVVMRPRGSVPKPPKLKPRYVRLVDRFETLFQRVGPNECWEWTGSKDYCGYGRLYIHGKTVMATHVALARDGRPRPEKLFALHFCDNPGCVNPAHLRWGTQRENMDDVVLRRRHESRVRRLFPRACQNSRIDHGSTVTQ